MAIKTNEDLILEINPELRLLIVSQSCRSYSYIDQYQLDVNRARLPKLKTITDQEIFSNHTEDYNEAYSRSLGSLGDLHLIERQINKYVLKGLCTPRTNNYGYAVLRINHLDVKSNYQALGVLAIFTGGLTSLIGIPAAKMQVEMDLSLEILDVNQKIIGVYSGKASRTAYIALYCGYLGGNARKKCMYESLESCLNQINLQIMRDFDFLERRLIKTKKSADDSPLTK